MSRWFRFYAESLRNPKVLRLPDNDFRLWVRLLAVASESEGVIPCLEDLKHVLSMRLDHLSSGVDRLISGGLIDVLEAGYEPHNWSKFQYKSDTSTDRVQRFRAKGNVSETPPDTEADTEGVPPTPRKRGSKEKTLLPEDWVLPSVSDLPPKAKACAEQWTSESYETHGEAFVSYWRGRRSMNADWRLTWGNRVIALHSQVMRDQKHGNAPPSANDGKPVETDRLRLVQLGTAEIYEKQGRTAEAAEIRRRWQPTQIADLASIRRHAGQA